jgi:hypothetical protein
MIIVPDQSLFPSMPDFPQLARAAILLIGR